MAETENAITQHKDAAMFVDENFKFMAALLNVQFCSIDFASEFVAEFADEDWFEDGKTGD